MAVGQVDALLLVSFGGPEGPDDVVPFLENVTRGRGIPRERLEEVGEHYFRFGGRSPINDQCRGLIRAIEADFVAHGIDLPVYWGNRNWHPYLPDALRRMREDGVRRALCLFTSAYASYSGCRQYRENLAAALEEVGKEGSEELPDLHRLPHYFNRAGFLEPFVDGVLAALEELPDGARVVFVTHSIPTAMNDASGPDGGRYVAEHLDAAASVAGRVKDRRGAAVEWDLAYCSRSGPPSQPWLEPDINDHLEELAGQGVPGVVVVPIGFVSDHMEVLYDLDTEARETAERLGLAFARVPTPGTAPDARFVAMVRDLVLEYAAQPPQEPPAERLLGALGPVWGDCPGGCCANTRGYRPACCGAD
ncbi:ferrochelatase [Thermasporomyces composti]|uniref:Coproporphyrin III ferrochelatase n=1 Tax=Thermasporomyces composti TaxID=696763 RepID=A0A3D9VG59_THECX|nr:ferrochelatase [Thermasporomyces composti]REF38145.1 ferrochelatase [Thermasporomyces composti]